MIAGWFDPANGSPYVKGTVHFPRLRLFAEETFLVDTGSTTTTINPVETFRIPIDLSRLELGKQIYGVAGGYTELQEEGILIFRDSGLDRIYSLSIGVMPPTPASIRVPSLLGQDILRYWRMVHDPGRGVLRFTVRQSDATVAI